ncbi:Ricin B-related lectin [Cordyceps fumosorosea ARSEF 2679]|uniref:Ricin B-related lectin n=1 Tax=Cordyceps fumosorosea (strain ARSEF 2679) TaxID=1081104 RepID=A0A162JNX0_CORFA|nr:Ricin B-related lectin [Cordyceps fumosorosea ARSEF 2679]OAA71642.1 Ricin B-related lectin [Cordyceps fumosorosea ARSEF 2679]
MSFPEGDFVLKNRAHCPVGLDVEASSTEDGARVLGWELRGEDNDNQRWRYQDGQLINVNSGKALTFTDLTPESLATQEEPTGAEGQRFQWIDGLIVLADNHDLCVGEWDGDVKIVPRDDNDDARRWDF